MVRTDEYVRRMAGAAGEIGREPQPHAATTAVTASDAARQRRGARDGDKRLLPLLLVWLLAAALPGGVLLSAARPSSPAPLYALSTVRAGLLHAPGRWVGRTVRVYAVAGKPCVAWMGGVHPACISWQPALLDMAAPSAADALPLRVASPTPLLAALRRLPLARWLVGAPQQIRWGMPATYRVRLQAAAGAACGVARCYAALLLDAPPSAL